VEARGNPRPAGGLGGRTAIDYERRMLSREFQLLVDACRSAIAGEPLPTGAIEAVHWAEFVSLARRHRVQALAWDSLRRAGTAVPAQQADQLAGDAARTAEQNLRSVAESARLRGAFEKSGVPVLFIKGLTLAAVAYPRPFLKMSRDIDILVPAGSVAEAGAVLRSGGYRLVEPEATASLTSWHSRRKESVWHKPDANLYLDLHTRLSDNPRLIPGIGLNSPMRLVEVAPKVALPTLIGDELFAYLCVHGASSAWFRLKWVTDIAALLRAAEAAEVERLYNRALLLGAGRAPAQALILANSLYGIALEPRLRDELLGDSRNRWLIGAALRLLAAGEPTARPFGTALIHLTQLLLLPGVRFKAGEIRRQLVEVLS